MWWVTVFFVFIIVVCTVGTILLNSLTAKIGRMESSQKELEAQLKKQFDLKRQPEPSEELADMESVVGEARQSYNDAVAKYNESVGRFPGMLIAGMFGFTAINHDNDEGFK